MCFIGTPKILEIHFKYFKYLDHASLYNLVPVKSSLADSGNKGKCQILWDLDYHRF